MQQLMQQEAERQSQQADSSDDQALNSGVSLSALASNFEQRSEVSDQEDREAQETLEREQLEKERLAEEALENELGLADDSLEESSLSQGSSTKKNSLFDD